MLIYLLEHNSDILWFKAILLTETSNHNKNKKPTKQKKKLKQE